MIDLENGKYQVLTFKVGSKGTVARTVKDTQEEAVNEGVKWVTPRPHWVDVTSECTMTLRVTQESEDPIIVITHEGRLVHPGEGRDYTLVSGKQILKNERFYH